MQDKTIGKRVFCISGTVPASNYVLLPKKRSQSLGLTGRFLYLQVRCSSQSAARNLLRVVSGVRERTAVGSHHAAAHRCYGGAQVQVKQSKDWAIHIEASDVVDKVHRLSLSNIYKTARVCLLVSSSLVVYTSSCCATLPALI